MAGQKPETVAATGAMKAIAAHATMHDPQALVARVLHSWGMKRPRIPSLAALHELHRAYLIHVPFENVTKLIKAAGTRDPEFSRRLPGEFWEDHLRWGTGGTCFDATSAFRFLLDALGFECRPVFCHLPFERPRTHAALVVTSESGPVLVDVGYALPAPVLLPRTAAARLETPYYDVEVRRGLAREFLVLSDDIRGVRFRYRFRTDKVSEEEFHAAWRGTFSRNARYMRRLALGIFRPQARWLFKHPSHLYILSRGEQKVLAVAEPKSWCLSQAFGISENLLLRGFVALKGIQSRPGHQWREHDHHSPVSNRQPPI